mmetsp:Transcript_3221/g.3557  ORF Transcript_3221/g.3557 Transcript_3221/m.3557 type:complete len:231 (+) Transcript_3221:222-914(+)
MARKLPIQKLSHEKTDQSISYIIISLYESVKMILCAVHSNGKAIMMYHHRTVVNSIGRVVSCHVMSSCCCCVWVESMSGNRRGKEKTSCKMDWIRVFYHHTIIDYNPFLLLILFIVIIMHHNTTDVIIIHSRQYASDDPYRLCDCLIPFTTYLSLSPPFTKPTSPVITIFDAYSISVPIIVFSVIMIYDTIDAILIRSRQCARRIVFISTIILIPITTATISSIIYIIVN